MKTAISIPDHIFTMAEDMAQQEGISRSELYTKAIAKYINKRTQDEITRSLNDIYKSETSSIRPDLIRLQTLILPEDHW